MADDEDTPETLEFRRQHARLTGRAAPRPAPRLASRPAVFDPDATERMENLISDLAAMISEADREPERTLPLAWSATLLLALVALCGLVGWVAYLYFTRGA